ncbi:BBP7 family outer membrane beta-barrel protein [Anatilimnocola sp. NA78]|uniref:BBP7 family outer membrane beta-barrel protein n=1 Tax=Anatilimnocola sp. NA78 TaxID=3415683 RepID=UPI003CE5A177
MSLKRTKLWFTVILAAMSFATSVRAEHPSLPSSGPTVQIERLTPFIEPDTFGPDFQFFAPADVSGYGGGDPPNIGFYFTYDRIYMNVQRPQMRPILRVGTEGNFGANLNIDLQQLGDQGMLGFTGNRETGYDGDFTWGNRYDFGYMTTDDHGWNAVAWHLSGPAEGLKQRHERINRINTGDDADNPDPILVDRNPRAYDLQASINNATFSSIELNKVWRRKEFHNGGVLEPFIGARYMQFKDIYRQDGYGRYALDPDDFPDLNAPNPLGPVEVLVVDRAHFENNMFGGQFGFRYFYEKAHWNLSTEVRAYAMHNFQYLTRYQDQVITNYGAAAATTPVYELRNRARSFDRSDEFVWGGELRSEAAYTLTRDISFRFGLALISMADGVGRGNDIRDNTEDLFMAGLTFGVTLNR